MQSQIKRLNCRYRIGHSNVKPAVLHMRLNDIARNLLPKALTAEFRRRHVDQRKVQILQKISVRLRLHGVEQLSDRRIAEAWAKSVADQTARQLAESDSSTTKVFHSEAEYVAALMIACLDPSKQGSHHWWCSTKGGRHHDIDHASDLMSFVRRYQRILPTVLTELRNTGRLEHFLTHLGPTNAHIVWRDLVSTQNETTRMSGDMDRWRPLFDAAMLLLAELRTHLPTGTEIRKLMLEQFSAVAGPLPRWGDRHAMSEAVLDIIIWLFRSGHVSPRTIDKHLAEMIRNKQSPAMQPSLETGDDSQGWGVKTIQQAGRLDDGRPLAHSGLTWLNLEWLIDQILRLKGDPQALNKGQVTEGRARRLVMKLGLLPNIDHASASATEEQRRPSLASDEKQSIAHHLKRTDQVRLGNSWRRQNVGAAPDSSREHIIALTALELLAAIGQQTPYLARDPFVLRLVDSLVSLADALNCQSYAQRTALLAQLKSGRSAEILRCLPERHRRQLNPLGDFIRAHGSLLSDILVSRAQVGDVSVNKLGAAAESRSAGVVLLLRALQEAGLHRALVQAAEACPRLPANILLWLPIILLRWAGQAVSKEAPVDPVLLQLSGVGEPMTVKDLRRQIGELRWSDLNGWLVRAHNIMALQGRWPASRLEWMDQSIDDGRAVIALHPESGCLPLAAWRSAHNPSSRPKRWSQESETIFGRRTKFARADTVVSERIERSFTIIAQGKIGCPKVDFAIGVLSVNLLLHWARWLRGLSRSTPAFLLANLVRRAGCLRQTPDGFDVQLDPSPYDLVLKHTGYLEPIDNLPWLRGGKITISVDGWR